METPEFVNRNDMYGQMAEPIIYERCPEILANGISVGFVGSNKKKTKNKRSKETNKDFNPWIYTD